MRELKFRAWDKDGAEYVDGVGKLYVDILEAGTKVFRIEQMCPGRYILEQYTGLKDKNGEEIYEGDIVKARWYRAKNARFDTKGEIKYDDGWFYIKDDPDGQDRLGVPIHNCYDIEIVGNIHEKKEEEE